MIRTVDAQRIGFGTVFRILLIGNLIFPLLLLVVLTLLSGAGVPLYQSGDEYVTGFEALKWGAVGIVLWIPWAVVWSGLFWLGIVPSLWIYARLRPFPIAYRTRPEPAGTD